MVRLVQYVAKTKALTCQTCAVQLAAVQMGHPQLNCQVLSQCHMSLSDVACLQGCRQFTCHVTHLKWAGPGLLMQRLIMAAQWSTREM